MPHHHAHDAESHGTHDHAQASLGKLRLAVGLTLVFVAIEAIAGAFAHSLALLSDAGHNFTDAAALGFSWYALAIVRKPAHSGMTYGYHRVGILAALVNAVSLVAIALLIFWEAANRFRNPESAHGTVMIVVAAAAVIVNLTIGIWLHSGAKHDLNVRSAYLHMMGDAISAVGVVIAGIIITLGDSTIADPIVSLLIGAMILYSSWGVLKESVNVLLEGTPAGMDMSAVERDIAAVSGVRGVHDLHVWTVGPGVIAASVHILVEEQTIRQGQQVLKAVVAELRHHHAINHTTVQVEVEGHASDDMYCCIEPDATHVGHHH